MVSNLDSSGWVPNRLVLRDGVPLIQMAYLESRRPAQAILEWDLDNAASKRLIPLSALSNLGSSSRPPAGMIFHTSRCGSTLLADMFRSLEHCKVISEPAAFADVFRYSAGSRRELIRYLRALASLFHRALIRGEERLIFKWTSWFCLSADIINEAFPDTPACFLSRDPVEVLISLVEKPAVWLEDLAWSVKYRGSSQSTTMNTRTHDPLAKFAREEGGAKAHSIAEFNAKVLGLFCRRIEEAGFPVLPVDYRDLPEAMLTGIAPHFNVPVNGVDKARARAAARWDTKRIGTVRQYSDDSSLKRRKMTREIQDAANRYAVPFLNEVNRNRVGAS